jgi:anti-sigma regulatory factor (Ser/Thr protein kinase)
MRDAFSRQLTELERIFELLRRFAEEHGLDADLERDLGVIVEELFTNQVRHARPGGSRIEVALAREDDHVRIDLIDRDVEPWDPTAAPEVDVTRPAEERTPGGLGIHFVRALSDRFEWSYDPDRRESRITVTRLLER